jgi:hypothetical protein
MGYNQEKLFPGMICEKDLHKIKEAVCIQVEKIYDSCKEKDCIEDARVYFRNPGRVQGLINNALNVKAKNAEVIKVFADVEEVPFKRGFYTVDVRYFIKVDIEFYMARPNGGINVVQVPGLITFDKKVILFGSEGSIKIFKSQYTGNCHDDLVHSSLEQSNLPMSKVEVAEPITLSARIVDIHVLECEENRNEGYVPNNISEILEEVDLGDSSFFNGEGCDDDDHDHHHHNHRKVVAVTIGIFSIVKLVRYVQLMIPAFDFCVPHKKCIASTEENPCELFETIEFPTDEFFPPQKFEFPGAEEHERSIIGEG